jgi:hypothetical protein
MAGRVSARRDEQASTLHLALIDLMIQSVLKLEIHGITQNSHIRRWVAIGTQQPGSEHPEKEVHGLVDPPVVR